MYTAIPLTVLKSISSECSLAEELPYESFSESGSIYNLTNGRKGFMFEYSPLAMADDRVAKDIESIITGILPQGSTMQSHIYTDPLIDFIFNRSLLLVNRDTDSPVNAEMASSIIKYQQELFKTKNIKRWKYYMSFSCPNHKNTNIENVFQSVYKNLKSIGLCPEVVMPRRLITFLRVLLNQSSVYTQLPYDPTVSIRNQIIDISTITKVEKHYIRRRLKINDTYAVGLYVTEYPIGENDQIHLNLISTVAGDPDDALKQLDYPFYISSNIIIPKGQEMLAIRLSAKASSTKRNTIGATSIPRVRKRITNLDYIQRAISDKHYVTRNYLHFFLFVKNEYDIPNAIENAKSVCRNAGFKVAEDHNALITFLSDLPMNLHSDTYTKMALAKTTHSQVASHMIFVQGDFQGGKNPSIIFATPRKDTAPMTIFNKEGNSNTTVSGGSGSGKSVFLNSTLMAYALQGAQIFPFDKGFSLGPLTELFGGDILRCDNKTKISINPLTNVNDIYKEVDFIWPIMAQMANPDGKLDHALVEVLKEKIIEEFITEGQDGQIQGIIDRLSKDPIGSQLICRMKSWSRGGNYFKYVDGPSTVSFKKQFTLLEMSEINNIPALKSVIVPMYLFQVYLHCFHGKLSVKKLIPMDEAHSYFYGASITDFMSVFAREIRKYGGMIMPATQLQSDFFGHPAIAAVYANCDNHIFLMQNATLSPYYPGLTIYDIEAINSIKPPSDHAEMYIMNSLYKGKLHLYNSDYLGWLFTTTPNKKDLREKYYKDMGGNINKAIIELISQGISPYEGGKTRWEDFY